MKRRATLLIAVLALTLLAGCGNTQPTTVATDPESIKKLEELQRKGAKGEK